MLATAGQTFLRKPMGGTLEVSHCKLDRMRKYNLCDLTGTNL